MVIQRVREAVEEAKSNSLLQRKPKSTLSFITAEDSGPRHINTNF